MLELNPYPGEIKSDQPSWSEVETRLARRSLVGIAKAEDGGPPVETEMRRLAGETHLTAAGADGGYPASAAGRLAEPSQPRPRNFRDDPDSVPPPMTGNRCGTKS